MVEKLGNTLIKSLGNQAPWRSSHCGRLNCWPCRSKEGACRKHNVVYRITCLTCKTQGRSKQYWGETHRAAWDRSRDHIQALKSRDDSYAVVKHWETDHQQQEQPEYSFEVLRSFRSSLERQIFESILIDEASPEVRLNSKAEWGGNRIPRLVIDPESQKPGQEPKEGQGADNQPPGQDQTRVKDVQVKQSNRDTRSSQIKRSCTGPEATCITVQQQLKRPKLNILDHFKSSD